MNTNDLHSDHEMSITPAQKLSSSSTQREIPKDVLVEAELLYTTARLDVAHIHNFFEAKFKESSREVTWTAKDLTNAFAEDPTTRLFDSTDFLKELKRRQEVKDLRYSYTVDSDGRLSLVFAKVDGGYEAYKRMGDKVVVFYDTTFGTNRYFIYYHRKGYCILYLFNFYLIICYQLFIYIYIFVTNYLSIYTMYINSRYNAKVGLFTVVD